MRGLKALGRAVLVALIPFGAVADQRPAGVPVISGLRHVAAEGTLRLILDVDPALAFTIFTLSGPDRLVVDFPVVRWRMAGQTVTDAPQIEAVRHGLFRHDRSRLILDLAAPLRIERAHTLQPRGAEPGRLVIDLAPTTREAFDAAAGAPEAARWHGDSPARPEPGAGSLIVAIDPGHGGMDPGARAGGLVEKTVVLSFARRLAAEIEARAGLTAYLIRKDDEFLPLAERIARAHHARAHLLISIHADSVKAGVADGMSVYILSRTGTDQIADLLAARENRADVLGGADLFGESDTLTRLLVDLARRGTADESRKLADALVTALGAAVPLLKSRPLRQGDFRVLKAPDLPSVLIELGFLDSPEDQRRLADPDWQARAAAGLVDGIVAWRRAASPGFVAPR